MTVEKRLEDLRIILPPPSENLGSYAPAILTRNIVYLSGIVPVRNKKIIAGKFGKDFNLENGKEIAELCALQLISNLKKAIGNLDKVKQIVKIEGFINSTAEFTEQSRVMNVVSNFVATIFNNNEKGKHSRTAIGVISLPVGAAMEISTIVELY
ncbi:MAG: RidA family protein [Caldisericota bacterium]|nr:RidA family protein [Caldisericota bacterium]